MIHLSKLVTIFVQRLLLLYYFHCVSETHKLDLNKWKHKSSGGLFDLMNKKHKDILMYY